MIFRNSNIQTVLLTGGAGKIGKQLIKGLNEDGYNVLFTSRNRSHIEEIESLYHSSQSIVKGIEIDLESDELTEKLTEALKLNKLYPQGLINNARNIDYLKISDQERISDNNWLGEFRLAVTIPYELTMFLEENEKSALKKVINIASIYGIVAPNLHLYDDPVHQSPINYGTCKAAMIHLTKELAVRLADKNIQVNSISYGGVEGRVNEQFLERYKKLTPQGKMLNENELYGSVSYLLSKASDGMTGHNLVYDGGWTLW